MTQPPHQPFQTQPAHGPWQEPITLTDKQKLIPVAKIIIFFLLTYKCFYWLANDRPENK